MNHWYSTSLRKICRTGYTGCTSVWSMVHYFVVSALVIGVLLACGEPPLAGGSSEETNAIAGIVVGPDGKLAVGAVVAIRDTSYIPGNSMVLAKNAQSVVEWKDTTNENGEWQIKLPAAGSYLAESWNDAGYKWMSKVAVNDSAKTVLGTIHLDSTVFIQGFVGKLEKPATAIKLFLPGTQYMTYSDDKGFFQFKNLPKGEFTLVALSDELDRFSDAKLSGVHGITKGYVANDSLPDYWKQYAEAPLQQSDSVNEFLFVNLPLREQYSLRALWSFDRLLVNNGIQEFENMAGTSVNGQVYGNAWLEPGVLGNALQVNDVTGFGVLEDTTLLFGLQEFTTTLWLRVDSLPNSDSYMINVFGKLGFSGGSDVFSIAIRNNECEQAGKQIALYYALKSQQTLDCAYSVGVPLEDSLFGEWVFVAAIIKASGKAGVSINGQGMVWNTLEQGADLPSALATHSTEPFYFAKEQFKGAIDEVRLYGLALPMQELEQYREGMLP
jgi:hypothetical protein